MGGPSDQTLSEKATRAEAGAKRVGTEVLTAAEQGVLVAQVKGQIEHSLGAASLTSVHVDTKGRTVTLTGSVSSADEKRAAELAAARVAGVDHVVNQIVVNPS
jgi:osmotically-inducible protein OsmY